MLRFQLSTFIFQLLNFFILLAVLTRFFYRPLQQVMKRQEEEIAARLREAEERAQKADAERIQLAEATQRLQAEAEAVLANAKAEAARTREQVLEQARRDADRYVEEAKQRVREMERVARQRLEIDLRRTAVTMAETLIHAAAGPSLHHALIEKLVGEGLRLDGDQGNLLRRAYAHANGRVTIEVAYPPTPGLEERFRQVLAAALGTENTGVDVTLRTEPSLIAGARLLIGTLVIDLSLHRTLTELSQPQQAGEEPR
ncbi:MAG TPA: F0F1 ATP synthase subunit delta [Methylomirabilota bacterium]|jgi:F-type H+-transporting ATPase subunit b|nr:F0F1 ATP synthase subunit delta [Methylomirabilota bacterium]